MLLIIIILLSFCILFLVIITVYLRIKLTNALNILKNLEFIGDNSRIEKDDNEEKKLDVINETVKILDTSLENIPEKSRYLINKLKKRKSQFLKMVEANKKKEKKFAEYIVHDLEKKPVKCNGVNLFIKNFDVFDDDDILKRACINLTKKDKTVVLFHYCSKNIFLLICCSDDIAKVGFDCRKIVEKINSKVKGGYGGKKSFSMFKTRSSSVELDVYSLCKSLIKEESKKLDLD